MKPRILTLFCMICISIGSAFGAKAYKLHLQQSGGEFISIDVADGLTCKINADALVVYSPDGDRLCEVADIYKLRYVESAGVGDVPSSSSSWRMTESGIYISAAAKTGGNRISVYSDKGILTFASDFEETTLIPFSLLPSGLQIIVIDNDSPIKVIIK